MGTSNIERESNVGIISSLNYFKALNFSYSFPYLRGKIQKLEFPSLVGNSDILSKWVFVNVFIIIPFLHNMPPICSVGHRARQNVSVF